MTQRALSESCAPVPECTEYDAPLNETVRTLRFKNGHCPVFSYGPDRAPIAAVLCPEVGWEVMLFRSERGCTRKVPEGGLPLLNQESLSAEDGVPVWLTEEEMDADTLKRHGRRATTNLGGLALVDRAEWWRLERKVVILCVSDDKAGSRYASAVRAQLSRLSEPPHIYEERVPPPPNGKQLVESWFAQACFRDRFGEGRHESVLGGIEFRALENAPTFQPLRGEELCVLVNADSASEPPFTIASGHEHFDRAQPFGGVAEGTLVVLGGEVGAGKSRLMLNLALAYAKQGLKVAYLLGEMNEVQVVRRLLSIETGLPLGELYDPRNSARLSAAQDTLASLSKVLSIERCSSMAAVKNEWAKWADVLFLDPLHVFARRKNKTEADAISALMRRLERIAVEGPIVFASAEVTQGDGGERGLHNAFKGSSSIKQKAHTAYFLTDVSKDGTQDALCLKQRDGSKIHLRIRLSDGWQGVSFEPWKARAGTQTRSHTRGTGGAS